MSDRRSALLSRVMPDQYQAGKMNPLGIASVVLVVVALLLLPFAANKYILTVAINLLRTAYMAQCWNLMSGYAGLFSFGHSAFFGLGAYGSTVLYVKYGISPWLGMFVGVIFAGLVGLFLGFLACRYNLKDSYFALTTLAFAEILRVIFNNTRYFNASIGFNIPFKNDWKVFQSNDKALFYFVMLAMVIGITVFIWRLRKTKMGLYFVAIRENEDAANALGVNVFRYKLSAIAISAMFTALGGTFFAQYYLFIDPTLTFANTVSINCIAPCVLGGVGTVIGPLIGAMIITPVSEFTNSTFGSIAGLNMVIYGMILIAVIMFLPKGVVGFVNKRLAVARAKKAANTEMEGADDDNSQT